MAPSKLKEATALNAYLQSLVKRQTREMGESSAANSKLIAIIAHDLRSPFGSVIGALELLNNSLKNFDKEEIQKLVGIAVDSANRTLTLLDSLLAWSFSQNDGNSFHPAKSELNLDELIRNEVERFHNLAIQKRIKVSVSSPSVLTAYADPQMVRTVIRNLLDNARKYTNAGDEINIHASQNARWIEVAVKDNGVGMSKEAQTNLFRFAASTAGTKGEKGVGLGLRLCKEIIHLHGGFFSVESEPGNGAVFTFTLPRNDPNESRGFEKAAR